MVKDDVMEVFHSFFAVGSFEKSLNACFIALIPKKRGAMDSKDFRLVSLIGGVYKLTAKVLSTRLGRVIGEVISEYQGIVRF